MTTASPACPKCRTPIPEDLINQGRLGLCRGCESELQVEIFPAFFRKAAAGSAGELVLVEGESTCFYHASKRAVLPCHGCGRFLCALCDCELNGEHFCPSCLEAGRSKGKIKNLENRRTLYDSAALSLAILPLLVFYFTFVTAPMALFVAIRYWNAPRSIVHRTKIRYVLAIVFAMLQLAAWGIGIYLVTTNLYG